ncbi:hypothetical protein SPSIL_045630 [Sporomusa silvacetica DSM 10669]|uniref:Outer membrane protein (OmpH-like) n=1 Tax=Sporomusa silvacetica DSM 10669 TaxID=1123289 RepID=A0ABZ3IRZ7_9FIRM|nr:OmpH family outer membrane protein [Sporomusa silvacetica]OZC20820.1 outer membrane protein (OmpH-like) [Sporomusa silvacetica DSM 10669]
MFVQKKKFCIALLITCLFTIAFGVNLVQAAPAPASSVGVVDFLYLLNNHPDTPKANEELKAVQEQAKKDFETKSAGLGDKEKRDLDLQLGQQLEQKRQELLKPISEKIATAIKEVRADKGLSVVLGKNIVIDGGVDITADVLKKLTSK